MDKPIMKGQEVSCRALGFFFSQAEKEGIDIGRLTKDLSYDSAHLTHMFRRIDWDSFRTFMDNCIEIWGEDELFDFGKQFVRSAPVRALLIIGKYLYTPTKFYEWITKNKTGPGNQIFSNAAGKVLESGDGFVKLSLVIEPPYEYCEAFFQVTKGTLAVLPEELGYPSVNINATPIDRGYIYYISWTTSATNSLTGKIRDRFSGAAKVAALELEALHAELHERMIQLEQEVSDRQYMEVAYKSLLRIAELTSGLSDLPALLKNIHSELDHLVGAPNFYVALYDDETRMYEFPYWQDECDTDFDPQPLEKSLTDFVRRKQVPLLVDNEEHERMAQKHVVEYVGAPSPTWMGAPLNADGKTFGVVVVQRYTRDHLYQPQDLELLSFMSNHISVAIQRMQREIARNESRAHYRTLVDNAPEGILVLDVEQRRFVDANHNVAEMLGLSIEELFQMAPPSIIDPDGMSMEEVLQKIESDTKRVLAGEIVTFEESLKRKGADPFPAEVRLIRLPSEKSLLIRASITDITERRKAESALRVKNERIERIVDSSLDAVILIDAQGIVRGWNPSATEVFGWTREEAVGRQLAEVSIPQAFRQKHKAGLRRFLQTGESRILNTRIEVPGLHKNGHEIPIELTIVPMQGVDGWEFCAFIRDLSEIKQHAREREKLEERIQQAQRLESLGVMAGGIAHHFNNILAGIMGNTGLALMEAENNKTLRSRLANIEEASKRAAELCRQMLAYSGSAQFVLDPLNLNKIAKDAVELVRASTSPKITFDIQGAAELPTVEGDAGQVSQVVLNLLTNAAEAIGDQRGTITINTSVSQVEPAKLVDAYLNENIDAGPFVILEVRDDGVGMSEEILSRIFDPFYTTKFTGRGLGLAAVIGIIRSHRGCIEIDSTPNQGTRFRIYLPAMDDAIDKTPATNVASTNGEQDGMLLVADDEAMVREVICYTLRHAGYKVCEAADGVEAVQKFEMHRNELSLIILDLTMPGLSGEEVLREIRKQGNNIPVVFSSGYSADELSTRFKNEHLAGFIQKPFLPEALIETVSKAIASFGKRVL